MIEINILMVCHGLPYPSTTNAFSFRVLESLEYLSDLNHNITLVSFKYPEDPEDYAKKYCKEVITFLLPNSTKKRIWSYITQFLGRVFKGNINSTNLLDYRFSSQMEKKIDELIKENDYDLIFVSEPSMLPYTLDFHTPKIIEACSFSRSMKEAFMIEKNVLRKIAYFIEYLRMQNYEKKFKDYDLCLTVTEEEKSILQEDIPNLNFAIIPYGIDVDTNFEGFNEDFPSIMFFGSLNSSHNQKSVLFLYKKIYPLIKEEFPRIKFFIVGKKPPKEILKLGEDSSVIVTGYVKDVKPYLACCSVVTLPIHGYGIKTRLLQTMAMGKPVVVSSKGISGINVVPGKDLFVVDEPGEFAEKVIKLLNNDKLRAMMGTNAKNLMEEQYSWLSMNNKLLNVFEKVVTENEDS